MMQVNPRHKQETIIESFHASIMISFHYISDNADEMLPFIPFTLIFVIHFSVTKAGVKDYSKVRYLTQGEDRDGKASRLLYGLEMHLFKEKTDVVQRLEGWGCLKIRNLQNCQLMTY
ncbi:hypothetical protein SLE2022_360560 [Rubroshorea leprosula]